MHKTNTRHDINSRDDTDSRDDTNSRRRCQQSFSTPCNSPLVRKFRESPVLSVSDVEMIRDILEKGKDNSKQPCTGERPSQSWHTRRYSPVFYIKGRLGLSGTRSPTLLLRAGVQNETIQSWDRYMTLSILARRLIRDGLEVDWMSAEGRPTTPFQTIVLTEFALYSQHRSNTLPGWVTVLSSAQQTLCRSTYARHLLRSDWPVDLTVPCHVVLYGSVHCLRP